MSRTKHVQKQLRNRFLLAGQHGLNAVLTLFYPRRCPLCDGILLPKEAWLCKMCGEGLSPILSDRCKKCGKPLPDRETEYCRDCLNVRHAFEEGFAAFPYSGKIQGSLLRFKQGGRKEYAPFYARAIYLSGQAFLDRNHPEVIIPIPMDPVRRRQRGYNQAELLADQLSLLTGIPLDRKLLGKKYRPGKAQKLLNHAQRRKNLQKSYRIRGRNPGYQRVLLVDDIFTTGSTIDAAALLLKKAGVKQVWFCTVAIGRNH